MGRYNIPSSDELSTLTKAIPGEIAITEKGESFILSENGGWKQTSQLTLYDLNKQLMKSYPVMSEENIEKSKIEVLDKFILTNAQNYYMLLSNELKYYTVFNHCIASNHNEPFFSDEVVNCLQDIGQIQSIDLNEDNIVEAWVKGKNEESYVLYLFPYDQGVIKCQ